MKYLHYKKLQWNLTKQLSNLNFSIALFLIIATLSIFGTIIEQDKNLQYYQSNYPINNNTLLSINWKTITYFGLDHIYATWWFLLLLLLFFFSLITCTFSRQLPSLQNARNWKFMPYHHSKNLMITLPNIKSLTNIIYTLNSQEYYVFQKDYRLYSYKGLIGRIAPIFVHISLIITLTGSMIGLFSGFTTQQMIPTKEIFHIQNIIKSGLYSHLPYNIIGKIDNFFIEYNKDHSIKQFYSDISLLNNQGQYLAHQIICVNSPLKFNELTFYQTAWNINGLKMSLDDTQIQQALNETKLGNTRVWIYTFNLQNKNRIFLLITGLKNKISIYNNSGNLIKIINIGERFTINNHNIAITEIIASTGLQIKTDPGIHIVYLGFSILIISIVISYVSYSQIWTDISVQNVKITGITNRGQLTFEEELITIQKKLHKYYTYKVRI
nr:Cytochrome c biogenesis protein [Cystoclonium purpureum f. stellatum]